MMNTRFDTSKLRGRIKEKGYTEGKIADLLQISHNSLSSKLNGEYSFKSEEIFKLIILLHINRFDVSEYFFKEVKQDGDN